MSKTRPTSDQIRFVSSKSGEHILDDYIEEAEKGTRTLGEMLADIFSDDGVVDPDFIQVRINATTSEFEIRLGQFIDPEAGWTQTDSFILKPVGNWQPSTLYKNGYLVNYNNGSYLCKTEHTSTGTFDASKFTTIIDATIITTLTTNAQTAATTATTQAGIATTQASNALTSANNAAASEALVVALYDSFDDRYLGVKGSDPSVDNDGDALSIGALYYNNIGNVMKVWDGAIWQNAAPSPTAVIAYDQLFNGTGSQTNFNLSNVPYSAKSCHVFIAGIRQIANVDYTLTGNLLTFTSAPASGTNNIYVTWTTPTGSIDQIGTSILQDGAVTLAKLNSNIYASEAEARDFTENTKLMTALRVAQSFNQALNTNNIWASAQRGSVTALTDGATVNINLANSNFYSLTLGGNRTLANPTNAVAGQSGCIFISQDGTGSRTLAYGSNWKFAGGNIPSLSTSANALDRLDYVVVNSSTILASVSKGWS